MRGFDLGRFSSVCVAGFVLGLLPVNLSGQAKMVDTTAGPGAIAITGGKLLTISHGVIEHGVIVLQDGKIVAVGAAGAVKIPAGAVKVDATGMTVYPGLIDSETNLGLVEVESDRVNSDLVETSEEIFPQMHVYDAFHAETERIPVARFNGVTNAVVAPESEDTMPGQDIFIQLAGRDRDTMIVTKDVALAMNFGQEPKRGGRGGGEGGAAGRFPSTRMGEISQLRQALLDAQEYVQKKADAAKKPASTKTETAKTEDETPAEGSGTGRRGGAASNKFDLRNEALIPYLKGKFIPAAMKMSSHPSALRSSTVGPHGQYVSAPAESETSSNRPCPLFAKSSFPKMNRLFPSGIIPAATLDESALRVSAAQSPGGMLTHMSGCMLVTKRSSRPSPSKSNAFTPIEPQGVFGKYVAVASRKCFPPSFSQR